MLYQFWKCAPTAEYENCIHSIVFHVSPVDVAAAAATAAAVTFTLFKCFGARISAHAI